MARLPIINDNAQGLGHPFPYLLAAISCTVLESFPAFDKFAQQPFFQHGGWLVSKSFHGKYKLLLYTGPKILIACMGIALFLLVLAIFFVPAGKKRLDEWKKPALFVLFSLILIPLLVAFLKLVNGVYSPVDLIPYGGRHPHVGFWGQFYTYGTLAGGRSFPAGHASGGFALMALYYLPVQGAIKKLLFILGLLAGWSMGIYQMARGEHFFSHTLTTMFLALAIITFLARSTFFQEKTSPP